ncbi:MAG TPA: glycerol-3-phosphate 1-O-acyltransferase [Leucothrix sp.]|nr:glycerol-3-phosphate 1-O-acyltransferase [Leucothrix sp.]
MPYFLVILSYFVGSLSTAIITCQVLGKTDPRTVGSKNPGATNVLRHGGKKAAALTLLGDMLKGVIPVAIGHALGLSWGWLALIGIAAFLGHLYPVYYGFKGGKGVATAFGVFLGLNPIIGIVVILTWIISALIFNISSLSALIATLLAPIYFYVVTGSLPLFWSLLFITIMIYWRHRTNIIEIINGTEDSIVEKDGKTSPNDSEEDTNQY